MNARAEAYPLAWPDGWPDTPAHYRSNGGEFNQIDYQSGHKVPITFDSARRKLFAELDRMKAGNVVLSTNLQLRADGQARSEAPLRGADPGVALYFTFKGKPMAMACDRFTNPAANTRSLGVAIESMRKLERHGGGVMMERAFAGFAALPPPEGMKRERPWWEVLHYSADPAERELLSVREIEARHATLAKRLHPDKGGNAEAMAELNSARDRARADLAEK